MVETTERSSYGCSDTHSEPETDRATGPRSERWRAAATDDRSDGFQDQTTARTTERCWDTTLAGCSERPTDHATELRTDAATDDRTASRWAGLAVPTWDATMAASLGVV